MHKHWRRKRTSEAAWIALALFAVPACALDLRTTTVWKISEGQPLKIGLVDKNSEFQNTYTAVMLTCDAASGVTLSVGPVDRKPLSRSISRDQPPTAKLVIDGKDFELAEAKVGFNFHDEHWQYEVQVGPREIEALVSGRTLKVQGTGLSLDLPRPNPKGDFARFREVCPVLSRSR